MASQALSPNEHYTWLIDSACTSHTTKYIAIFTFIDKLVQPKVKLGNGEVVQAKGKGTVTINTKRGTKVIANVLCIPVKIFLVLHKWLGMNMKSPLKINFVLSIM